MISDYYLNNYITYTKSGSMTSDGTYVYTSSLALSGNCRLEPISDNEGSYTHKIFMDIVPLDEVDTIYVDGDPYEIKSILNYFNHHLELEVFNI